MKWSNLLKKMDSLKEAFKLYYATLIFKDGTQKKIVDDTAKLIGLMSQGTDETGVVDIIPDAELEDGFFEAFKNDKGIYENLYNEEDDTDFLEGSEKNE